MFLLLSLDSILKKAQAFLSEPLLNAINVLAELMD
jgi:hypothetical protein